MMRVLAFLARVLVFGIITAVGFSVIPTEDLLIDRSLRLSISALQVLFLTGIYALHVSVSTILHVIRKSSPLSFSRLELEDMREQSYAGSISEAEEGGDGKQSDHMDTPEMGEGARKAEKKSVESKGASKAAGARDGDSASNVPSHASNASSLSFVLTERDMSCALSEREVSFASQVRLDWYILRVHVVGLALWQTFLSFDCTSRDIDICFITGLVMGWFLTSVHRPGGTCLSFVSAAYYAALLCTVILSEEHIFATALPAHDYLTLPGRVQLYFNICILPFLTGVFWVVAADSHECAILLDARRSVVTFLLISLTFPLYWSRLDLSMVQVFLAKLPHLSIFSILIMSPVFKVISIYVMLLSLQKKHTLDLVMALALVLVISSAAINTLNTVMIVRLVVAGVLLAGHVALIQLTSCRGLALT